MKHVLAPINPRSQIHRITHFIQKTLKEQHIRSVVIGVSGGIDSTVSLFLLTHAIGKKHIFAYHLPYFSSLDKPMITLRKATAVTIESISIKAPVDAFKKTLNVSGGERIRLGNIMARVRMIMLYDFAKKHNALVCGTENKSEHLLGYFTRFGDEASDIEPIRHLYKTQIYKLAQNLGVPKEIIDQTPTAGLWGGQTDEGELGFTYEEADCVLYLYYDKKYTLDEIKKQGYNKAKKIINWTKGITYKHHTPYVISHSNE